MEISLFDGDQMFQYRPPTAWALANLCRGVVYFRSPRDFNDPYDSRTPPMLRHLTDKQFAYLRGRSLGALGKPSAEDAATPGGLIRYINGQLKQGHEKRMERCGVACFSKRNDNLLLWSHYADSGKGFCLAFDNNDPGLGLSFDVKYRRKFPTAYDYVKQGIKGKKSLFPALLLTHKYKEWEYEQEVRMIQFRQIGEKHYPPEILKAVYLGTEAEEGTIELVRTIVEAKYPHAELWQGRLTKDECRVEFTERLR